MLCKKKIHCFYHGWKSEIKCIEFNSSSRVGVQRSLLGWQCLSFDYLSLIYYNFLLAHIMYIPLICCTITTLVTNNNNNNPCRAEVDPYPLANMHIPLTIYGEMHSPFHKLWSLQTHTQPSHDIAAKFACAYFVFDHATLDTVKRKSQSV